jgi:hypothetical protein
MRTPPNRGRSPRLEQLADYINQTFPEVCATVHPSTWRSTRKAGRIIVHRGPERSGFRLAVHERGSFRLLHETSTADPNGRVAHVSDWIERYRAERNTRAEARRHGDT